MHLSEKNIYSLGYNYLLSFKGEILMKSRLKLAPIAIVALIAITLIFGNGVNDAINTRDGQGASAIDPASSTISPELREVIAKARPNDLIRVWVEFDADEYEKKLEHASFHWLNDTKYLQ